jgi:hypothetical protein
MTHPTLRAALFALLASAPLTATAQTVFVSPPPGVASQDSQRLTGIRASVAHDLRHYGFADTDVRRLSASQLAAIHHLAHSGRSDGEVRGQIGSALRGGLLQRALDRLTR